jgi:OOP family OmpA-OmpF porin
MKALKTLETIVAVAGRIDLGVGLTVAAIALAMIATSPLHAAEESWYVGLGLGVGIYSEDESTAACDLLHLSCETDGADFAFKIMGGYQFTRNIAVEIGYSDWGGVSVNEDGLEVLAFNSSGFSVSAIPELPLGKHFSIFAEIGMSYMTAEVQGVEGGPFDSFVGGASEDVWAPFYGLGVAWNLKRWTFRLQWERIDPDTEFDFNDTKVGAPNLDVIGLTAIIRF